MRNKMCYVNKFDYFSISDYFKETENVKSTLIFGNENGDIPLVTIAIPTYKRSRTLSDTINSALNQKSACKYEIIVVDNNPEREDETELLMKQFRDYQNVRYYKNCENIGMAGNWNRCFSLPKSKWVVLLHDDDFIHESYLNTIVPLLKYDIDAIFPKLISFQDGKEVNIPEISQNIILREKKLNTLFLSNNPPSGIIMRRKKVLELGGYSAANYAPDIFLAKMLYFAKTYKLNQYLTFYRIGLNESTKFQAMEAMCQLNHDFRLQAWPKMGIPKFMVPHLLLYCDKVYEDLFRRNFNDLFRSSLISKYTKRQMLISRYMCLAFNIYFRVWNKLFDKRIRMIQ